MASVKVLASGILLILFVMDVQASVLPVSSASSSNVKKIHFSSSNKNRNQLGSSNCGWGTAEFGSIRRKDTLLLDQNRYIAVRNNKYDYEDQYSFETEKISFVRVDIVGSTIKRVCIQVEGRELYVDYSVEAYEEVEVRVRAYGD